MTPLVLLAALLFALEDWLWDPITRAIAQLMRHPVFAATDRALRALPPWAGLAALLVPGLPLIPLKFIGLALIAHGHAVIGIGVFVAAKVAGTALLAWIWSTVQAQVRTIGWADRAIDALLHLKAGVYARVLAWPAVIIARRRIRRMRARMRSTRRAWQAWRAARALARRERARP